MPSLSKVFENPENKLTYKEFKDFAKQAKHVDDFNVRALSIISKHPSFKSKDALRELQRALNSSRVLAITPVRYDVMISKVMEHLDNEQHQDALDEMQKLGKWFRDNLSNVIGAISKQ